MRGKPVRIAVIGQGKIGATLGAAFAAGGHDVTFGSRHPEDDPVGEGSAKVAGVAEALDNAEVVLFALPAVGVEELLAEHAKAIDGKLVIDATNRITAPVANAAAAIAEAAPGARYVRAFNTLGWENFADPVFDGVAGDLFYSAARADQPLVEELISAVGLRPAYLGENQQEVVDGVLRLWFALVQAGGGNRRIAFRVLRK